MSTGWGGRWPAAVERRGMAVEQAASSGSTRTSACRMSQRRMSFSPITVSSTLIRESYCSRATSTMPNPRYRRDGMGHSADQGQAGSSLALLPAIPSLAGNPGGAPHRPVGQRLPGRRALRLLARRRRRARGARRSRSREWARGPWLSAGRGSLQPPPQSTPPSRPWPAWASASWLLCGGQAEQQAAGGCRQRRRGGGNTLHAIPLHESDLTCTEDCQGCPQARSRAGAGGSAVEHRLAAPG